MCSSQLVTGVETAPGLLSGCLSYTEYQNWMQYSSKGILYVLSKGNNSLPQYASYANAVGNVVCLHLFRSVLLTHVQLFALFCSGVQKLPSLSGPQYAWVCTKTIMKPGWWRSGSYRRCLGMILSLSFRWSLNIVGWISPFSTKSFGGKRLLPMPNSVVSIPL